MTKVKDKKDSQINVRTDPETYAKAKKYCDENGMKIGWLYSYAVKQYLQEIEKLK